MTKRRQFAVGPGVQCDIERLVNTRLLLQAASGAGKSWALRRLLEQTHGSVQQLVIDPEGEFSSLRAKFDYVLAARQGGDTLADPRTAKLLAERLLELGVSAILDISELKAHERVAFVKLFVDAIVEAPKALWHPCLIVLDEAQMFAPEDGDADSADAVKSLATRGRKRGFSLVAATQRLSSLSKDVAAQLNNKLIGRTSLDVDVKRAAYELGFNTSAEKLSLRDLEDGEFFAFGPALTKTVEKVKVGTVQTEHPKAGSALAARVPPPTEKVQALLPKLSDLPAEAEAREKTVADLKRELANTRRELTDAKRAQPPAPKVETKTVPVLTDADRALMNGIAAKLVVLDVQAREIAETAEKRATRLIEQTVAEFVERTRNIGVEAVAGMAKVLEGKGFQKILGKLATVTPAPSQMPHQRAERTTPARPSAPPVGAATPGGSRTQPRPADGDGTLSPAEARLLTVIASEGGWDGRVDRTVAAICAGYSVDGGGFRNTLSAINTSGLLDKQESGIGLSDAGRARFDGVCPERMRVDEIRNVWRQKLSPAEWRLVDACIAADADGLSRAELAERCNYDVDGGGFRNTLSAVNTNALILKENGRIYAHPVLR